MSKGNKARAKVLKLISAKTGLTASQVQAVLHALPEAVTHACSTAGRFEIGGLGTFKKVLVPARKFKDKTGAIREVPERALIKFKFSSKFQRRVQNA